MKRSIILISLSTLALVACTNGMNSESSRVPKGNPNAAVKVMEFADFECPACATAHFQIGAVITKKYGNQIRYDFMHFPLRSIHRYALDIAEMSECAADQGKFWEYTDIAFAKKSEASFDAILDWADEIGLDVDTAEKCWKSHSKRKTVLADYKEGRSLDVQGTPTFFVNGKQVQVGVDTISEAIDAALKDAVMRL